MSTGASQFPTKKYWIFFKDKPQVVGFGSPMNQQSAEDYLLSNGILTERAIERREKVLPPSTIVSSLDFPVDQGYLDSLRSRGAEVVGTSRWFNGAVVTADSSVLIRTESLPFVVGIRRIVAYTDPVKTPVNNTEGGLAKVWAGGPSSGDSALYGPSLTQLELSGVPQVHALGINGQGVLIGMLDAGFRYETHDALKNVKIVGEHDFIQNDSITANQPNNNPPDAPNQDNHGTSTLSVLGGYSPGNIIGVSYGSSFLLAKTEYVPVSDFKWEEDNWVEGIEWMEARGVDVVSSSVAYNIFVDSSGAVDSSQSYFFWRGDFNGKKSIASRAATRAAELGVVVVQAMGNEGNGNGVEATMDVPADADSIISVGAVNSQGKLAGFSSTGPTNDGRIKPDLVADGVTDYVAVVPGPDTYAFESGTSFSTPITAGIASLILSVRPEYTPMQVINLLKSTAVRPVIPSDTNTNYYPNNFYGWGIVNAWDALQKLGFVSPGVFASWQNGSMTYVATRAFSTSGVDVSMSRAYYSFNGVNFAALPVFTTDTSNQYAFAAPAPKTLSSYMYFYFDLVDSSGAHLDVPYYGASKPFAIRTGTLASLDSSEAFRLYTSFPNPFSTLTQIGFVLKSPSWVNVDVYDILGRKLRHLFSGEVPKGYEELAWDGRMNDGELASSGVYLIRVEVNGTAKVLKVLFLK